MKLTVPAPQNIKRRETFLLAHPDYYSPKRFEYELLMIAKIRSEKKLRWEQPLMRMSPQEDRRQETAKTFEVVKPNAFKRTLDWIKPKFTRASQRGN